VKILGPFVFKWSMHDALEQTVPLDGSVTMSVDSESFTNCDCMGSGVVKSSKCTHIRSKALNQTLPSDCSADSESRQPEQPSSAELKRASVWRPKESRQVWSEAQQASRAMKRFGLEASWSSLQLAEPHVTKLS
jgi:hypothetical protein